MAFDLAGVREWGAKAIELAERLDETEVLVAAIGNVGTVELAHGLAEGREKLQRAPGAGARRRAGAPRGGRLLQPRGLLPRHPRLRDGRGATSTRAARICDEHDLLAWEIYLGGWEAHIALDHGRWAEAASARRREPRAHARRAAAQPVPLAARRRRPPRPPRRRRPVAGSSTRRSRSRSRRTSWTRSVPSRSRGRRRAGSPARTAWSRRRPPTRSARAERSDHRWLIGELAIWRHRAQAAARRRRAPAAALPGGAHGRRPRGRGVLARPRMPLRRRAGAGLQRGGGRSAREPARAAEPRRATRGGDRRAAPARARSPRRAARAAGRDAREPGRAHRARARRARAADAAATATPTSPRSCSSPRRPSTTTCRRSCASSACARRGQAAAEAVRLGIAAKIGSSPEVAARRRVRSVRAA